MFLSDIFSGVAAEVIASICIIAGIEPVSIEKIQV